MNLNPNVNKNRPLIFQRRDLVPVGSGRISDADSTLKPSFNSNGPALNFNVSKFQTISLNDSAVVSDIPIPPRPTTPSGRKLRKKKRAGGDGYESDGGYVSETGKKKDKKKGNSGEDVKQRLKEDKLETEKKRKSFIHIKISTTNDIQPPSNKGLETNSDAVSTSLKSKSKTKKSKTNSSEIGYETDGGYQSSSSALKKSKTRFFKLPLKSSKGDLRVEANESVPALPTFPEKKSEPVVPLPIAERFATTLTPNSTVSLPMPSPTTKMEGGRGSPLPPLAFQPFPAYSELTSTLSPSPVSPGPSTFNPIASAPPSNSPSAFNTSVAHLHLKNRDSHSSLTSSSSSSNSGSIQHQKSQKRIGLFSPPPSSMHSHQQHSLRTASSLSSLKGSPPVISLPITRPTSPTSALQPSPPHSRSVSHLPPFVSPPPTTSVAPLQINKIIRTKPLLDKLSLRRSASPPSSGIGGSLSTPTVSLSETPSPGLVRPRNPPTDGFGPRPAPTPDSVSPIPLTPVSSSNSNNGLFPPSHTQGHLRQTSSQLSIVPSSDYIVPSPRNSPSKTHPPGHPSPIVLSAYYHHDYIPPPPNPAPMGPLPILPSGGNISPAVVPPNGNSSGSATTTTTSQIIPSVSQLRQRMTLMRPSVQQDNGIGLNAQRGKEPPFPPRPVQSTVDNASGIRRYPDVYNGVSSGVGDTAKLQEKRFSKQSWVDIDEDTLDERENFKEEDQEVEEPDDLYDILDRFDDEDSDDIHHSISGGNALERSMSYTAGKKDGHPNGFEARPRQNNKIPADAVAHDNQIYSFEDDGKTTVGDRTSRWSGSIYSRSSLLDEGESEETRDRFVRRVEAMLDADRKAKREAQATQVFVPPIPKIPDAYSKNIVHHKPNGRNIIHQNAGIHSNITTTAATTTPGRSWIKF